MGISLTTAIIVCAITAFILFVLEKLVFKPYRIWKSLAAQVPAEPFVPVIGQLPEFIKAFKKYPTAFSDEKTKKHGDTFVWTFGPFVRFWSRDADYPRAVMTTYQKSFAKSEFGRAVFSVLLGRENILMSNGDMHQQQRKTLAPVFHYENMKSMVSLMTDCTEKVVKEWDESLQDKNLIEIELHQSFSNLTLDIVSASVFGSAFAEDKEVSNLVYHAFGEALSRLMRMFFSFRSIIPVLRYLPSENQSVIKKVCGKFETMVSKIVQDRISGKSKSMCKGSDLLDLLLKAKETDKFWDDELISAEARTFILAGHETTSNLLTWTCHALTSVAPDVWAELRKEVDEVLQGEIPRPEHLTELKVLDAVLHESLRVFPPVYTLVREAIEDVMIEIPGKKNLFVPKGTQVFIPIHSIHQNEAYWPNPLKFDHTRWLTKQTRHPCAFIPFGGGSRNCIGNQFALMEAKVIMAMIIQKFDIEALPGQDMTPVIMVTARPRGGLAVKLRRRVM